MRQVKVSVIRHKAEGQVMDHALFTELKIVLIFSGHGFLLLSHDGLVMDHAFACLIEDCADLQQSWVLAFIS